MKKKTSLLVRAAHSSSLFIIYMGLLLAHYASAPPRIDDDSTLRHTGLVISLLGIVSLALIGFKQNGWSWRQAIATIFLLLFVLSAYNRYDWLFVMVGITIFAVIASKEMSKVVKEFLGYMKRAYREISGKENE
jgi:hypothetical protein